jgi:multidrug efflux pump
MNRCSAASSAAFNRVFKPQQRTLRRGVTGVIQAQGGSALGVYAVLLGATVGCSYLVPGGFVPAQDKQYLIGFAQLPEGASLDRTDRGDPPHGRDRLAQPGREGARWPSPACRSTASPTAERRHRVRHLKPFDERKTPGAVSAGAIAGALNQQFGGDPGRLHRRVPAAAGHGPGHARRLQAADRGPRRLGYASWTRRQAFMGAAKAPELGPTPVLPATRSTCRSSTSTSTASRPSSRASVTDVFDTMQIYLGSLYVNDFNRFGRTYQVAPRPTRRSAPRPRTSAA